MFSPHILVAFVPDLIVLYSVITFILMIVLVHYFPQLNSKFFSRYVYSLLMAYLSLVFFAIFLGEGLVLNHQIEGHLFYPVDFLTTAPLIVVSKLVVVVLTIICVYFHFPVITDRARLSLEYSILIMLITEASLLFMSVNDLSLVFLAMELQTLGLVAFAFVGHASPQSVIVEAVTRYFINTAYASASFLFGLSLLYGLLGSLHLDSLPLFLNTVLNDANMPVYVLLMVGVILIFYTIFFKLTLAPFHQWVGDLYQGTSGYVGTYFSVVSKIPMLVLLYKMLLAVSVVNLQPFLLTIPVIAVLSLAIGNIYAFHQPNFKRFWAMASIGHMGQILLAMYCFGPDTTLVAFLYLFSYITGNIFFWAVLLHQSARPSMETGFREFFQKIFRFLSLNDRRLSWLTMFILASLAGVPPAFGFVAKFYLFLQLYSSGNYFILAVVFFLNLVSLVYYLRLIRFIFFDNPVVENTAVKEKQFIPLTSSMYAVLTVLFLLHVFFGLWSLVLLVSLLVSFF